MAEVTESIRKDSARRKVDDRQINDWSGRRLILPRGTTLPTEGLPGEVFVKINDASKDQMYIWDDDYSKFVTVGPIT